MILVEYYPGYDIGYDATKMYVDISSIRYITHTTVGGHKYLVIGLNGESFTLTDESGKDLLCRMGLSKEEKTMKWNKVFNDELPNDFEEVLVAHCTEDGEYLYPLCHVCEYRRDEHEWVDSDTGEERLVDSSDCWIRIKLPENAKL